MRKNNKWKVGAIVGALSIAAAAVPYLHAGPRHDDREQDGDNHSIRHVLLISIDGMHALDFINCAKGISGVNGGAPYRPLSQNSNKRVAPTILQALGLDPYALQSVQQEHTEVLLRYRKSDSHWKYVIQKGRSGFS